MSEELSKFVHLCNLPPFLLIFLISCKIVISLAVSNETLVKIITEVLLHVGVLLSVEEIKCFSFGSGKFTASELI